MKTVVFVVIESPEKNVLGVFTNKEAAEKRVAYLKKRWGIDAVVERHLLLETENDA